MRTRREIRRARDGRRKPLRRRGRSHRSRRGREIRLLRQDRHLHRHARQIVRRRHGRFHHRTQGDHRHAPPAFTPLPLLQLCSPSIVGASIEMFRMLGESDDLHTTLMENVAYFRDRMLAAGFDIKPTQRRHLRSDAVRCKTLAGLSPQRCRRKASTSPASIIR